MAIIKDNISDVLNFLKLIGFRNFRTTKRIEANCPLISAFYEIKYGDSLVCSYNEHTELPPNKAEFFETFKSEEIQQLELNFAYFALSLFMRDGVACVLEKSKIDYKAIDEEIYKEELKAREESYRKFLDKHGPGVSQSMINE